jgi:hypothetical protein
MAWLGKDTLGKLRARGQVIATMELEVLSDVAKLAVGGPREEELRTYAERQALHVEALQVAAADTRGPADQWVESVQTLGKAEAWEIDAKSAQLQEMLQQVADAFESNVLAGPDLEDDGTWSKLEAEMKQAVGTGVMDMRGAFGRYFYREMKMNKLAKAEFKACGKSYDKQRAFKAKFAETSLHEKIEQRRTAKDETFNLQSVDAEYCSFNRIVFREGGDLPAFETAKTFVRHAMLAWQDGKLFHGHPWVKHDNMRGGAVVLHYREKLQSGSSTTWEMRTAEHTTHHAPGMPVANAPGNSSDDPTNAEGEQPDEPIPKKRRPNPIGAAAGAAALANFRANRAAAKKGESRANPAAAVADETAAAAAAAGELNIGVRNMQAAIRKAKNSLKLDVSKATQAVDILTLVAQNEDWSWCNCDTLLAPVRRCLILVEDWKQSTKFWEAWTAEDSAAITQAEQVMAAITQAARDDEDSLRKITDRLHSNTIKLKHQLKRMQASKNLDD